MNRILIPIDFSDNAERALAAAKAMANKETTSMLLLHAYQPHIVDTSIIQGNILPGVASPEFYQTTALENEFESRLKEYAQTLNQEGYSADTIWSYGSIQSAIEDAVKKQNPDLIIMGRTGTGGFLDKLIGSSATNVALHSPCPVMIIPPQVHPRKFFRVVYATQFEYEERDVLREVFALINHLEAKLQLLKINADTQPDIQPDNQYISEIKREFAIPDDDIVTRTARYVIDGIEQYCDEIQADLLIVSSRERSFIEEFLINPSLTKKLLIHTHIPLLVFHLK